MRKQPVNTNKQIKKQILVTHTFRKKLTFLMPNGVIKCLAQCLGDT